MKELIIAIAITACIALCAAETAVAEHEPEEESAPTENKISLVPQTEEVQKANLWQSQSQN